jgi:hyperosmotically inducible periplasmic protein
MRRLFILTLIAATAAIFAGCETTAPNTNNARNNVNNNSNKDNITVVNNNGNGGAVNSNTNRWNSNISKEEYEKNRTEYEKDKGSSSIGQGVNDSWTWFKVRSALMTTADLRESTINVDVNNDVVTLKGSVANAEQKKKAEEVAKGVNGVKSVTNQLTVAAKDSVTNLSTTDSDKKANTNTKKQ